MRFATDVGGTFTDLVVEDGSKPWRMYKAPTVPGDVVQGLLDVLALAAEDRGCPLEELLAAGETLLHGTTHALNALITGRTARTAFLTTEGHPDILVLREGGRAEPFNHAQPYPEPYIPRSLTFEVPERVSSEGNVLRPLDVASVVRILEELKRREVQAVGVCLLWSVLNSDHEEQIGNLLEIHLPTVPYTLSHRINPVIREYRRASATAIDASLKPLMTDYLRSLEERLREAGFEGRILMLTSQGGVRDVDDTRKAPIHLLNSGPSMAPVAGRHFGHLETHSDLIVADAGGTTYDVSLVRGGRIGFTRETWIGRPFLGHMTGFPSVDVKSVGAGGGSVAWVDEAGALHVGPHSMGADPGPACYALGGTEPTVTDAAIVLGYLDPGNFLDGRLTLKEDAAFAAIEVVIASKLGLDVRQAAWAILSVATENMVQAILDITVNQGISPENAVLIGGGGAAGLNSVFIARRLGCAEFIIPQAGAALSAAGALLSDLRSEYRKGVFLSTATFDRLLANQVLSELRMKCTSFLAVAGGDSSEQWVEFAVEARYRNQVWEIQVPLPSGHFDSDSDVGRFIEDFHASHERIFGILDSGSPIEIVNCSATACCRLQSTSSVLSRRPGNSALPGMRNAFFEGEGFVPTAVYRLEDLAIEVRLPGPAIIESPFTTVVLDRNATFRRTRYLSLVVRPV